MVNSLPKNVQGWTEKNILDVRIAILEWRKVSGRDLPWRKNPSPYSTLVSEFMLQQTRVETVLPRFESFMKRFPNLRSLAKAPWADVRAEWSGLGYYTRARKLWESARSIDSVGWPRSYNQFADLPGVGPYTAGALTCFILGQPAAAVDGNIERVITRLNGGPNRALRAEDKKEIRRRTSLLVDPTHPADWLQGMLDLGATVCIPASPKCLQCPLTKWCVGFASGNAASLPVAAARPKVVEQQLEYYFVMRGSKILLKPQASNELLADAFRPPMRSELPDAIPSGPSHEVRHLFSHRAWIMSIQEAHAVSIPDEFLWIEAADYPKLVRASAFDKLLEVMAGPLLPGVSKL